MLWVTGIFRLSPPDRLPNGRLPPYFPPGALSRSAGGGTAPGPWGAARASLPRRAPSCTSPPDAPEGGFRGHRDVPLHEVRAPMARRGVSGEGEAPSEPAEPLLRRAPEARLAARSDPRAARPLPPLTFAAPVASCGLGAAQRPPPPRPCQMPTGLGGPTKVEAVSKRPGSSRVRRRCTKPTGNAWTCTERPDVSLARLGTVTR